MTRDEASTVAVTLGFVPESLAIPDDDHPGLRRAGPRVGNPYGGDGIERQVCIATDWCRDGSVQPDLLTFGFDTVDLTGLDALQHVCARMREAGSISDEDAAAVRSALEGTALPTSSGRVLSVLHVADEGLIMRKAGPNGMSLVPSRSKGMNGHGAAMSIHADQDVFGTPLAQLMDGRAPSLFCHDSPDGSNHDAGLMLVNVWIPLQQITQPLMLGDGRSIDRRRHQLRYGLATDDFLERDDEMAVNDIWRFLHHSEQRWYLRSDMDHRTAYVFNTLSTPHGASALPGEGVAEQCYRSLEDAEAAVERGYVEALTLALAALAPTHVDETPPALRAAIDAMLAVADEARRDPVAACGAGAEAWLAASRAARRRVVRMSLELRLVVAIES